MKTNQEKVRDFMLACEQDVPEKAYVVVPEALMDFRNSLIEDEVAELVETDRVDIANIARELADILYVVYGTALAYGLNLDDVFDLVHQTNMKKISGPVREDGKRMKPPGFKFPHEELRSKIIAMQLGKVTTGG